MKPIFTIHAGEYLVASEIEKILTNVNIWLPSKDTGIDLLLTDKSNKKTISLQVKFSKDFNTTHAKENLRQNIKGTGWWTLNEEKIKNSQADYWVLVIYSFYRKTHNYIIIKPTDLLKIFRNLKRTKRTNSIYCYFTVTAANKAFETRGLKEKDMEKLGESNHTIKDRDKDRDVTKFLNNWKPIIDKLK